MKTVNLKKIGLTKEQIKYVMVENGKNINNLREKLEAINNNYIKIKTQLNEKNDELSRLNKQAHELDKAYTKRLDEALAYSDKYYQEKLLKIEKQCAKEKLFGDAAFASKLAKKAAMIEFENSQFEFKEGKYLHVNVFFEKLKKVDPNAFRKEITF